MNQVGIDDFEEMHGKSWIFIDFDCKGIKIIFDEVVHDTITINMFFNC